MADHRCSPSAKGPRTTGRFAKLTRSRTRIVALAVAAGLAAALAGGLVAAHGAAAATTPAGFTFAAFGDLNLSGSQVPPAPFTKVMDAIQGSGASVAVSVATSSTTCPTAPTARSPATGRWKRRTCSSPCSAPRATTTTSTTALA